ncbi:hypothetical protein, variant 1 [Aphanomyces invadans]|uniref:Mediator of RNA polymerase II transcription subunit 14 n=2 Tax=Aphanomyces invadans TaxID=157072 RepID=A0A024TT47_9STRA|nr:hypothetical protein, variant 1 [Aphanomyces invadans]ETV96806.1 hypothetical protein, variant 1 [Aphanomyces invadans]|eukprot:XP_008874582.1 hypothetical protein, variant 1 [Aphanomyces invadans]
MMETNAPQMDLRDVVSRCIERSYDSIRTLAAALPTMPSVTDRRTQTLAQLVDARIVFEKLLATTRWSVQTPIAEQCIEVHRHIKHFDDQFYETHDRLRHMHAALNELKVPHYDLNGAIDVLYGGSYSRLPRVIHHAMQPRRLPPIDEEHSIQEINDTIRFRMIEEIIPDQFTDITIADGCATTFVEGQFQFVFTVNGNEPDSLWRVLSVHTILTDRCARIKFCKGVGMNNLRVILANAPTAEHNDHLKNLVQKCVNNSSSPLVAACAVLLDFCSRMALQIVLAQGHGLAQRWPMVDFRPVADHALDILYWKGLVKAATAKRPASPSNADLDAAPLTSGAPPLMSTETLSVRLHSHAGKNPPRGGALFSIQLYPSPPPELLVLYPTLLEPLRVPTNLYKLSAEQVLLGALELHAASVLFCLERKLVLGATVPLHLMTGEAVSVVRSPRSFRISRMDSSGQAPLEVSFDVRSGRFVVLCLVGARSRLVDSAVNQLETVLNTQCKVQLPRASEASIFPSHVGSGGGGTTRMLALEFDDESVVHKALAFALREIVAFELTCFAASCANVEVQRHVQINWDKYINFRQQTGNSIDSLSLSPHALFFQIVRNKESSGYLVVEFDRLADMESDIAHEDDWVRSPAFSLLQLQTSTIPCAVQFFQRFPAFRKDAIPMPPTPPASITPPSATPPSKKRKLAVDVTLPFVSNLFLHVISLCHERIQLQHYVNFARRRRVKIKYAGQGGTALAGVTTGEQIVSFPFPDRIPITPLNIKAVHGHLRKCGGFEMCVQLVAAPFDFIIPSSGTPAPTSASSSTSHSATSSGNLIFRYPHVQKFQPDNPLETFMAELITRVKPMADFGVKLQRTLSAVGRYSSSSEGIRDHFYVERADPFGFVLACRTSNPKRCVAAGSTADNLITYRVTIEYSSNPNSRFVLSSSHQAEHPLLNFIQTAFNLHMDSAQLLEALERTTIPLGILSSAVSSQLISAKCYRHDNAQDKLPSSGGPASHGGGMGKKGGKGGKGMRLGYKVKLPGEEKGYYAEKSYGGDDKSFVPAELLLIPRSQNHIRLTYADRCGIDIYFLEVSAITTNVPVFCHESSHD